MVVTSKTVTPGETNVTIPILMTNDVEVKTVSLPLALREITPGAFVTSLQLSHGDRLPPGGPISMISFTNQYATEDGDCKSGSPGGFGTTTHADGGPHPVGTSPEGIMFVRGGLFSPYLPPGVDVTGSFILTVDVTSVEGSFEIDTTCMDPATHLMFTKPDNQGVVPFFMRGVITIEPPCHDRLSDVDCDGFTTALDLSMIIDILFAGADEAPPCIEDPVQTAKVKAAIERGLGAADH
jgi:hypothetical protein